MPFVLGLKRFRYILLAVAVVFLIHKAVTAIQDHFDRVEQMELNNATLTANNASLTMALEISQAEHNALVEENARLHNIDDAYHAREAELNDQLIAQREETRNEIAVLETALRDSDAARLPVPADIIRMHCTEARAVNREARAANSAGSATTDAHLPGADLCHTGNTSRDVRGLSGTREAAGGGNIGMQQTQHER